jgi:hypothetical protein
MQCCSRPKDKDGYNRLTHHSDIVKSRNLTLKYVIDAEPEVDTVLETEIDEGAGCMMLYKPRIFGAMIGIVPLIRGQQQLAEYIR